MKIKVHRPTCSYRYWHGCGNKKEAAHDNACFPEISVARPSVQDITLTKNYPGYLTSEKTVDLVGRVSGTLQP